VSEARTEAVTALLHGRLAGFAELLRARGIAVGAHELMDAVQVLEAIDLTEQSSLYWGLRLTMVRNGHQLDVFDEAFRDYWEKPRRGSKAGGATIPLPDSPARPKDRSRNGQGEGEGEEGDGGSGVSYGRQPDEDDAEQDDDGDIEERAIYSEVELLGSKTFAEYTAEDHRMLVELLTRMQAGGPWRLSRRKRAHRRGGIDIRSTVRASFRTEGHPVRQLRQRPQLKHRRLTFVCDVSGSMEQYSRAMLELAHVALISRRRVEAFAFATRLTRLTRELLERDPGAAIEAAMAAVVDWSGGTRVGDCLAELDREHRSALQGAVVVIASDGWDLGDPERLANAVALLQRLAHRVIWVNPQLQDPAFEPLTRGMSAALPYVDDFISCHNFGSFVELIELLEGME
jgi:uncharacterized protein